jgi:hypothetical protein
MLNGAEKHATFLKFTFGVGGGFVGLEEEADFSTALLAMGL